MIPKIDIPGIFETRGVPVCVGAADGVIADKCIQVQRLRVGRVAHPFTVSFFLPVPERGCPVLAIFARAGTMLPIL